MIAGPGPHPDPPAARIPGGESLLTLARVFLRLGCTAFGGPAAHISLMEEEFVRRRSWLTREELLDLIAVTHLIPGPNSTELALLIGQRRAGTPGLLVAGLAFILPAALMVGACAWMYVRYGAMPSAQGILAGVQPVILAIIVQALRGFAGTAIRSTRLAGFAVVAAGLAASGWPETVILLGCGLGSALTRRPPDSFSPAGSTTPPIRRLPLGTGWIPPAAAQSVAVFGAGVASTVAPVSLPGLFGLFLKTGALLFGSGYVLLAFLRRDFVEARHWLTETQLLDAIAVGQFTPGPVFTTATFIGYLLAGTPGAVVATVGIFLPAFLLVAASGTLVPRLRLWPVTSAFLDGLNAASVALMGVVTLHLARAAWTHPLPIVLSALALLVLVRFRVNSAWLVLIGALLGWAQSHGAGG